MSSLEVDFAGVKLRNPVVVAACPATETVHNILACAKAGAGAVTTKSIARYNIDTFPIGFRRTHVDYRGLWATSAYRRETLTLEAGTELVSQASQDTDTPIFASVTALDMEPDSWYPVCHAMQEAGASLIQLDLFYMPQPICSEEHCSALAGLVRHLARNIKIPVVPKLNIEIPVFFVGDMFANTGIAGISLLDSVRMPPPVCLERSGLPAYRFVEKPSATSLFGSWQLPLTLHYTHLLSRYSSLPLCSGGGLMNSSDALEVIMHGATAVQFATAVLLYGYDRIKEILFGVEEYLERNHIDDIAALRGVVLRHVGSENETSFTDARAEVDHDLCNQCGRCLQLSFCAALTLINEDVYVMNDLCDGCSLCEYFCETGALKVKAVR